MMGCREGLGSFVGNNIISGLWNQLIVVGAGRIFPGPFLGFSYWSLEKMHEKGLLLSLLMLRKGRLRTWVLF